MSDVKGFKFLAVEVDKTANNGLGEHKAHFAVVREGRENEADSIVKAYSSAQGKGMVRVRDGVVAMNEKQVQQRIETLKTMPKHAETLAEFVRANARLAQITQQKAPARNAFGKSAGGVKPATVSRKAAPSLAAMM